MIKTFENFNVEYYKEVPELQLEEMIVNNILNVLGDDEDDIKEILSLLRKFGFFVRLNHVTQRNYSYIIASDSTDLINVLRINDEWYLIEYYIGNDEHFYKCDQLEGALKCLNMINKKSLSITESLEDNLRSDIEDTFLSSIDNYTDKISFWSDVERKGYLDSYILQTKDIYLDEVYDQVNKLRDLFRKRFELGFDVRKVPEHNYLDISFFRYKGWSDKVNESNESDYYHQIDENSGIGYIKTDLVDMDNIDLIQKLNVKIDTTEITTSSTKHKFIRCHNDDVTMNIYKIADEWYIIECYIYDDNIDDVSIWYKCDQLEGLLKCLKDIL